MICQYCGHKPTNNSNDVICDIAIMDYLSKVDAKVCAVCFVKAMNAARKKLESIRQTTRERSAH